MGNVQTVSADFQIDDVEKNQVLLDVSARGQNEGLKFWYEVANIIAIRNEVNIKEIVNWKTVKVLPHGCVGSCLQYFIPYLCMGAPYTNVATQVYGCTCR